MVLRMWRSSAVLFMLSATCWAAAPQEDLLAESLGLSAEAEVRFWPLYTEYRYEITKLRDVRERLLGNARANEATLNAAQADEFVEGWLDNRKEEVKLTERFVKKTGRFLSDVQIARMLLLELPRNELTQMPTRTIEEK